MRTIFLFIGALSLGFLVALIINHHISDTNKLKKPLNNYRQKFWLSLIAFLVSFVLAGVFA